MKEHIKKALKALKKFWDYIWHDDSFLSYVLNFALAFLFIKYLFFPGLGLALNNDYPVVAIVSGSMEHDIVHHQICDKKIVDVRDENLNNKQWWSYCGDYYENNYNITLNEFEKFDYPNGLNIGDVMILYGKDYEDIDKGDILVFEPNDKNFFKQKGPVIHRVMDIWQDDEGDYHFQTKGDHNPQSFDNFERDIPQEKVIGVGVVRIPFVGYAKIALVKIFMGIATLL